MNLTSRPQYLFGAVVLLGLVLGMGSCLPVFAATQMPNEASSSELKGAVKTAQKADKKAHPTHDHETHVHKVRFVSPKIDVGTSRPRGKIVHQ